MKIREQRISERIAKLKEYGVYEKWEKNLADQTPGGVTEQTKVHLLGVIKNTSDALRCSFMFGETPEGYGFWNDLVIRLINSGD